MGNQHTNATSLLAAVTALLAMSAAATAPAFAKATAGEQEKPLTTTRENAETARIFVSGNVITDYVHRSHPLTAFTDSFSNPTGVGNPTDSHSENTFEGEVGIRFTAELTNKVTAVVEIGSRRVDGAPAAGTGGINRYGEGEALAIRLKEAHVFFPEVFLPELQAQLGITTWSFNIRGKGGAFAFDPRNSQTVTRNLDSDLVGLNVRDNGDNRFREAAFTEPSQPVGVVFTWGSGPVTSHLVLLPLVTDEGGSSGQDDQLYALDALLALDSLGKGSRAGLIVAVTTVPTDAPNFTPGNKDSRTRIITVGGGTTIKVLESLEAYVEGYTQTGRAGQLLSGQRIAAGGRAFQLGVEWHHTVANPMPIWAGLNFTHISGESTDGNLANRKASRFAGYEGVNDLMILEDPYFGFDWDSNYQATKISGGLSLTVSRENDLDLMLIAGITRAVNRVNVPTGGTENKLGNEVDVKATWHFTKQLDLKLSIAYLWGSTLLEKSMGGNGNPNSKDTAWLFVLGWDLKF